MRNRGTTSAQMLNAPAGCVFVWCTSDLFYPTELSRNLGRTDLEIVRPSWLTDQRWQGREFTGIELDHHCKLTTEQYDCFEYALTRIRK